jgi:hypothetical protein
LPTTTFSKTYNLFRLLKILDIVKECFAQFAMSETKMFSLNKGIVLEAAREGLSVKVTLSEDLVGQEMLEVFRGKPKVKADIVTSSDDSRTLARFLVGVQRLLIQESSKRWRLALYLLFLGSPNGVVQSSNDSS